MFFRTRAPFVNKIQNNRTFDIFRHATVYIPGAISCGTTTFDSVDTIPKLKKKYQTQTICRDVIN